MDNNYDFCGWATKNDVRCADGRIIRHNAFIDNDGQTVPLVWNHSHSDVRDVLGHALLMNKPEGVYCYGKFNETENGQSAKELVMHGDITSLSIYANHLKQNKSNGDVYHGNIREVSLVLAGANPSANIESVMAHSADGDNPFDAEEAIIYSGDADCELQHSDEITCSASEESLEHSEKEKEDTKVAEENKKPEEDKNPEKSGKTIKDIVNTMNAEQKDVLEYLISEALKQGAGDDEESDNEEGDDEQMKHNVFDHDEMEAGNVLCHADEEAIVALAKQNNVGSLQQAMAIYAQESDALAHGIDDIETLFPEFEDTNKGTPETLTRDQGWVDTVMSGVHKSPITRVRTRQADARVAELRAKGYQKPGDKKTLSGNIKLLSRTTDPQTVYRKDQLNRDDIIDITDFDVVAYQWETMKRDLNEEIATAIMIGDGREEGDPDKISEEHIRSVWNDDDLYTIHVDVDVEAAKAELQGTDTAVHFGDNYVYAEAIISAALYAREKYKGSGNLTFYCTPHLLNVMLLARDLNGRRIYSSKADLAAALNVTSIQTAEQFEGKERTDKEHNKHKLLGLFVNLNDYQVGATRGGEITKFDQFDIDFNQYKYLIETRISGALTKVYSAIALEEPTE